MYTLTDCVFLPTKHAFKHNITIHTCNVYFVMWTLKMKITLSFIFYVPCVAIFVIFFVCEFLINVFVTMYDI